MSADSSCVRDPQVLVDLYDAELRALVASVVKESSSRDGGAADHVAGEAGPALGTLAATMGVEHSAERPARAAQDGERSALLRG